MTSTPSPHARYGDDIFVFGSNLAGMHAGGAAAFAMQAHGAAWGVGEGPTGRAYALPTMDIILDPLPLIRIAIAVTTFLTYAREHPEERFYVTRIGCGIAGYSDPDIAPLFGAAPEREDDGSQGRRDPDAPQEGPHPSGGGRVDVGGGRA